MFPINMIIARAATTACTTASMIHVLVFHPQVQNKLQKELDDVVGSAKCAILNNMQNIHFTNATMLEEVR